MQEVKAGTLAHPRGQAAEGQAPEPKSETSLAKMKAALSRARTQLREAEQEREAESGRATSLQEELRRARAEAQEECDRRCSEMERLAEEIQALEREKETLKAGSRVLQDAATRAEVNLSQARQSLHREHLRSSQLAQELQQREEELREARQELQNLQRNLERHGVTLAQLGAEKGALEEALGQAESCRRQVDKESWRLKATTQAQEEALAEQGRRLALLEAQTRQQAAELCSLQEGLQSLGELEQENASLRRRLEDQETAAAVLEQVTGMGRGPRLTAATEPVSVAKTRPAFSGFCPPPFFLRRLNESPQSLSNRVVKGIRLPHWLVGRSQKGGGSGDPGNRHKYESEF